MWHIWGRGEVHTGFWWKTVKERGHLEDVDIDVRIMWKGILSIQDRISALK
jgi:hypothetical protein